MSQPAAPDNLLHLMVNGKFASLRVDPTQLGDPFYLDWFAKLLAYKLHQQFKPPETPASES